MASLAIDGADLVLRLGPWERLGALQRDDLRVPVSKIRAANAVESAYGEVRGFRVPGTSVPGVLLLGTWRARGRKDFVAVHGKGPGCVIELDDAPFDRWVVSEPLPPGL
ncbi:MAG: hypothetical protein R2707_20470 [Acidimicrobiales bacterium]